MMYELDERTVEYFEEIKKNVGLLIFNACEYGIEEILTKKDALNGSELQLLGEYDGYANSSPISIYSYLKNGEKRYCAELSYQIDIDDYVVETIIFNVYPSRDDVVMVRDIDNITYKMKYKGLKAEFQCWECGKNVHWLDCYGDFKTKMNHWLDKYCGC